MLESIRQLGPVSRAQVARATGLSKPTVSQALASLESSGLVREAGRSSGGKGPTAVLYEVNASAGFVVGLDVGRSHVRAALADLSGQIVGQRDERARARTASSLIEQIGTLARRVATDANVPWVHVAYACVGSPGVLQPGHDSIRLAPNLPGWEREGVLDAVRHTMGRPVAFENDVNLATLGEQRRGLGKGVANFVYLHIGTGVGMGLVLNGDLYHGNSGAAGEVGYLPIAARDPHDRSTRRRGALESAVSAAAVVEEARRLRVRGATDAKAVFDAARDGSVAARRATAVIAERIALAIATVAPIADPELVILGGGIGRQGDVLLEPVEQEVALLSPFRPRIEVSALGEDAELQGAIALGLQFAQALLFDRTRARPSPLASRSHRNVRTGDRPPTKEGLG